MNEEQMQRVREKLAEAELREHEERQTLRHEVLSNAERDTAITTAAQAALLGTIPSIIWLVVCSLSQGWAGVFQLFFGLMCFFMPFLFVAAAAGVFGGLFAHWWFANSTIRVQGAAIAMALLTDAMLLAWVIVLT
jgi:hypothetical protein